MTMSGPRQDVLSAEDFFMSLAFLTAKRSPDPKTQVHVHVGRQQANVYDDYDDRLVLFWSTRAGNVSVSDTTGCQTVLRIKRLVLRDDQCMKPTSILIYADALGKGQEEPSK